MFGPKAMTIDFETIGALKKTVAQIHSGEVTGMICIKVNGEDFEIVITGSARMRPVVALGAVAMAKRQIEQAIIKQRSASGDFHPSPLDHS
jgi:hypothetical protein